MKYLLIVFCLLLSQSLFAQDNIETTVQSNTASNKMQNKLIADLQNTLEAQNWKIDTLTDIADINAANIEIISDSLHIKVLDAHSRAHDAHDSIAELDVIVAQNKTFWIVGSLVFLLLMGILYIILKKQIDAAADTAENKRANTESTLRQEAFKLADKLDETNKAQVATDLKLTSTISELESTDKALGITQKELAETKEALEATNKELAAANKLIADLHPKE